jgi:hypothetical protein
MLPGSITYLDVVGYEGRATVQLAPKAGNQFGAASRLPTAYTESLFDWLGSMFDKLGGL